MRNDIARGRLLRLAWVAGAFAALFVAVTRSAPPLQAQEAAAHPVVVQIALDDMVQPVSAEYIKRGIAHANEIHAAAVLLTMDTPGGLSSSMQEIIQAILDSKVPVIAYVSPQGGRAASAALARLTRRVTDVIASSSPRSSRARFRSRSCRVRRRDQRRVDSGKASLCPRSR